MFKVSLVFFTLVGVMLLVAGIVLWNVITAFGWVTKVESLTGSLAGGSFKLRSGQVLRAGLLVDVIFVLLMVFLSTLLTALYNLIADVTGGVTYVAEDRSAVAKPGLIQSGVARIRRAQLPQPSKAKSGAATPKTGAKGATTGTSRGRPKPSRTGTGRKAGQTQAPDQGAKTGTGQKPPGGGAGQKAPRSPVAMPTKAAPSP